MGSSLPIFDFMEVGPGGAAMDLAATESAMTSRDISRSRNSTAAGFSKHPLVNPQHGTWGAGWMVIQRSRWIC